MIYYLFLHAIELALKSYLRQVQAVALKELRGRAFGHDIFGSFTQVTLQAGVFDRQVANLTAAAVSAEPLAALQRFTHSFTASVSGKSAEHAALHRAYRLFAEFSLRAITLPVF